MDFKKIQPEYTDDRGKIVDILERVETDCVTLITSKKGARRGDHYHKKSLQYLYVLSGRLQLLTQMSGEKTLQTTIESGHMVSTPPWESHAFIAIDDSTMIVLTRGPRGGSTYEDDTYRLSEPLSIQTSEVGGSEGIGEVNE
ncbi:MAG: hypothetical protein A2144_03870 [Chloroflexi bacterium RBG_16_50_9]|nr:MAG: hypothetical protein A2144_03870 [Chloroflexi bacterium RBG_16_50_9]